METAVEENVKKAIATYNKYAKLYADRHADKVLQFQLNDFISKLPGKKILDVGCGSGRDVQYFMEEGLDVIGIDISEGMLSEAKSRCPDCKFEKMDILSISYPENTFDGVWVMASLSDIPKANVIKALEGMNKVLKGDGVIYIAVKEGDGEKLIEKKQYENSPRFYSFYRKQELEDYMKKANFKVISSVVSEDEGTRWVEVTAKKL